MKIRPNVSARLAALVAVSALSLGALTATPAQAVSTHPPGESRAAQAARFFASDEARRAPQRALVDSIRADLPADWLTRVERTRERLGLRPSPGELALQRLVARSVGASAAPVDPGQYVCGPTRYDAYVESVYNSVDQRTLQTLSLLGALDVPSVDASINGRQADPRYAVLSSYRSKVVSTFTREQTFWAVPLTDVQLVGVHGQMLTDPTRTALALVVLGLEPRAAQRVAKKLATLVLSDPRLEGGANPLFTLGAFATTGEEDAFGVRKVVMGDGLLESTAAIGLRQVGAQTVVSHEMGHQLQIATGLLPARLDTFTKIRRVELEADGLAGYFLAHPRGGAFTPAALAGVALMAYNSGDCDFNEPGSHGTPNQRRASAQWGVAEVAYASDPTVVATAAALDQDFTRALRLILAPDAAPTSPASFRALVTS